MSNSLSDNVTSRVTRKPNSPRKPAPPNTPPRKRVVRPRTAPQDENSPVPIEKRAGARRSRVFGDASAGNRSPVSESFSCREPKKGSVVINRMREWERERQRLREMEEVEERMREAEEERQRQRQMELEMEEEEMEAERRYAQELEAAYAEAKEAERQMEAERQREAELAMEREREREEVEQQRAREMAARNAYPRISILTSTAASSPPATLSHATTPLSPLIEGKAYTTPMTNCLLTF